MIKLILSDMDGTLLDSEGKLPPEFDAVMARLRERGVLFAPASGRQYDSLAATFARYVDTFLFLSDNGTMVRRRGQELFSNVMDRRRALEILDHAGGRTFSAARRRRICFVRRSRSAIWTNCRSIFGRFG